MASYIALFNWTDQGIHKVKDTVKRAEDFKASIQNSGGSLKSVYWTMGRYDGVLIFEAPNDETAAAVMMSGCALGNVRTETLRAFSESEIPGVLAKVGT